MKKVLLTLAFVMGVGVAATQAAPVSAPVSPGSPTAPVGGGTPFCAVCGSGAGACYANYGVSCTPPSSSPPLPHCSDQQAHDWCPGWSEMFPGQGVSNTL